MRTSADQETWSAGWNVPANKTWWRMAHRDADDDDDALRRLETTATAWASLPRNENKMRRLLLRNPNIFHWTSPQSRQRVTVRPNETLTRDPIRMTRDPGEHLRNLLHSFQKKNALCCPVITYDIVENQMQNCSHSAERVLITNSLLALPESNELTSVCVISPSLKWAKSSRDVNQSKGLTCTVLVQVLYLP